MFWAVEKAHLKQYFTGQKNQEQARKPSQKYIGAFYSEGTH